MNLMNGEKVTITAGQQEEKGDLHNSASQKLHQNAVLAMSNLLNANIDTGLMYAIGKESEIYISLFESLVVLKGTMCDSRKYPYPPRKGFAL